MTDKEREATFNLAIDILKSLLKPGYLYGKGPDGEIYCVEAEIPWPGEMVRYPPMRMPEEVMDFWTRA